MLILVLTKPKHHLTVTLTNVYLVSFSPTLSVSYHTMLISESGQFCFTTSKLARQVFYGKGIIKIITVDNGHNAGTMLDYETDNIRQKDTEGLFMSKLGRTFHICNQ